MAGSTIYQVQSAAYPTTAITAVVSTGTAIKTLIQLTAPSTRKIEVVAWGISADGSPDIICELLTTGTVAGTGMTAITPAPWSDPNGPAALSTGGFQPSAEGTITVTRMLDLVELKSNTYVNWFPLAERPQCAASGVLRVRVDAVGAVNALAWILFTEV
jgi:hypothetical protein